MIDVSGITENELNALIEWVEAPVAMEYFFPKLLQTRAMLLSQLVATSENNNLANILRGQIQLADKFLNVHDQLLAARKDSAS